MVSITLKPKMKGWPWFWKLLLLVSLGAIMMYCNVVVVAPTSQHKPCTEHEGIIVASLHGRLANNLFQIAMANRLAEDLCWPVVFKPGWQGDEFFEEPSRALQCFPNGMGVYDTSTISTEAYQGWFDSMKIADATNQTWNTPKVFFEQLPKRQYDPLFQSWWKQSLNDGTLLQLSSRWEFDYTSSTGWDNDLIERLRHPGDQTFFTNLQEEHPRQRRYDTVRTLLMDAFFIHYAWMEPRMESIRKWHAMNEAECCHHIPPPNAVVIHIRNFAEWEDLNPNFKDNVYVQVLDRFYFGTPAHNYVLWIVCQPADTEIELVKTLQERYKGTVIVTGDDPYDAFCTLQKASQLILSTHSTFSQMAALLNVQSNLQVHYLLPTKEYPEVTLVVPHWNYHLVEPNEKDSIQSWNVPVDEISPTIS